MNSKALVVNGLHRGGTTMMERFMDSQNGMVCMGHVLEIVSAIARVRGFGDKAMIARDSFTEGKNVVQSQWREAIRETYVRSFLARIADLIAGGPYESSPAPRIYGLTLGDLAELLTIILGHEKPENVADLLAKGGEQFEKRVFGVKWTGAHRFAPAFLVGSPNSYWIEIVRNPYARQSSASYSHRASAYETAIMSDDQFSFASEFRHERYHVLRYEDLCANPSDVAKNLSDWMGEEISNCSLVDPLGGRFRPNTSESIAHGKSLDFSYQDSSHGSYIGSLDPDRWRNRISKFDLALVNEFVTFHEFYERESSSAFSSAHATIYGGWRQFRAAAGRAARRHATRTHGS